MTDADVRALVGEGLALAEQTIGKPRVQMLWNVAPTLVTVASRYARREPVKAAFVALIVAGLFFAGRALAGASAAPRERQR